MFDFEKWTRNRRRNGSLADLARRMYEANLTLEEAFERFQECFVLEALMANEGVQLRAARTLGCHRNQLRMKIRSLGLSTRSIRHVARALKTLRETVDPAQVFENVQQK